MPPYILPKSLFNITLLKVQALVTNSCINIEHMYGSYDYEKCKEAVNGLQQYLLLNIPGLVFDEVYKERNRYLNACAKFQDKLQDQRISLAVYIHHNMRTFSIIDRYHHEDEHFWISHFCKLHNIVMLDLHLICTDEILEVIGKTCFKLEEINIVSKLEPVSLNDVYRPFNALKLRFFVSDQGLKHLSNCKKLKKVTMNKMLRSQFGGRMMTDAGIRNLIRSLPCIETVTYDDMGVVISDGMEDLHALPLKYLSDHHPNPAHVKAASRLCINLRHLCLHLHNQTSDRSIAASDILETLASSNLQLETLELLMFPCRDEDFLSLLKLKGQFLTSLTLQTCYSLFTESSMRVIGHSCPNLATLNLKEAGCKTIQLSNSGPMEHQNFVIAEPLFCNLVHLSIIGIRWRPDIVLPLCLSYAKRLQSLTGIKFKDHMLLDQTFTQILITNPLTELTCIIGCVISMATIHYFIKQCPKLERLYFVHHSGIKLDDIQQLEDEIKYSNLNLKLESMRMRPN